MKITSNADEVAKKLRTVPAARARRGLAKATRAAAKYLAGNLRQILPRKTGASVAAVKVRAMKRSRTRVGATVRVWIKSGVPYFGFRDLGTSIADGGRFFDRTARTSGPTAIHMIVDQVLQELE